MLKTSEQNLWSDIVIFTLQEVQRHFRMRRFAEYFKCVMIYTFAKTVQATNLAKL